MQHHRYILPSIVALLPRHPRLQILDAGCGSGVIASRLAGLGHDVTGVDSSPDGIRLARQAYPRVRYEVASVYDNLTGLAPAGGWDVVISSEVIEHLYAPGAFLRNMRLHMRGGGCAILSTPYHGYLKNLALSLANGWDHHFGVERCGGHIKFFSQHSLAAMLKEAGFSSPTFRNAGRAPLLWKSLVCRAFAQ